jgi:hypothetical protein
MCTLIVFVVLMRSFVKHHFLRFCDSDVISNRWKVGVETFWNIAFGYSVLTGLTLFLLIQELW